MRSKWIYVLAGLLVAPLFVRAVPVASAQDTEYEYEYGEGVHEEEWYDPSDWGDDDSGTMDYGRDYGDDYGSQRYANEDEWYDPSDWFDGNNQEYDDSFGTYDYGDDDNYYAYDDYYGSDSYDDDYSVYGYTDPSEGYGYNDDYDYGTEDYYTDDWWEWDDEFSTWYDAE